MHLSRAHTIAFSGNRNLTSPDGLGHDELCEVLRQRLCDEILHRHTAGYNTFITGMAVGWDMLAAEVVLALRESHPDIRLVAAVPFEGQSAKYSPDDKARYESILAAADHTHVVWSGGYSRFIFHLRNDYLIANSSLLIAYDCGESGGTASTIKKATKKGLRVVNLYAPPAATQMDFGW